MLKLRRYKDCLKMGRIGGNKLLFKTKEVYLYELTDCTETELEYEFNIDHTTVSVFKTLKADCNQTEGRDLMETSVRDDIPDRGKMMDSGTLLLIVCAVFVPLNIGGILLAYRVCGRGKRDTPQPQRERVESDRNSIYGTYGELGHYGDYTTVQDDNDYYISSV